MLSGRSSGGGETWQALTELDDYVLDQEAGKITLLGGCFVKGKRNYRVTCTAGYSVGAANTQPYAPDELEKLCIAIARRMFRNEPGVTAESIGTWSKSYNPELAEKDIDAALALFTQYSF